MPTLVWKLLRQHISIGQLAGFFLANLFGMMIYCLAYSFIKMSFRYSPKETAL